MIASIKVWMTKELPGISENGSGVGSIFTSGGCGSMFLCLKKYFNRCVLILTLLICTGSDRKLVYLNDYQLVHVYSLIKVFNLLVHLL